MHREDLVKELSNYTSNDMKKLIEEANIARAQTLKDSIPAYELEAVKEQFEDWQKGTRLICRFNIPIAFDLKITANGNWEYGHVEDWKLIFEKSGLSADEKANVERFEAVFKDDLRDIICNSSDDLFERLVPSIADIFEKETCRFEAFDQVRRAFEDKYKVDFWSLMEKGDVRDSYL